MIKLTEEEKKHYCRIIPMEEKIKILNGDKKFRKFLRDFARPFRDEIQNTEED